MMKETKNVINIKLDRNNLNIEPCKLEIMMGDTVTFNYTGENEAMLVFIGGTPLEKDTYVLHPGKAKEIEVMTKEDKSYGYVVSTNPAGGGSIIIKRP